LAQATAACSERCGVRFAPGPSRSHHFTAEWRAMGDEPGTPTNFTSAVNQETWVKKSSGAMMNSRNLTREMLNRVRQNEIAEAENKQASEEAAQREKMHKKKTVFSKAKVHEGVIDTSFKCMQDIEDTILQMEDTLTRLRHVRMAGFAAMEVAKARIVIREKRPPAEHFKDNLTDALDKENNSHENWRGQIFGLEDAGRKIVEDLNSMRTYLSRDTGERRLEMAHDMSSLKPDLRVSEAKEKTDGTMIEAPPAAEGEVAPPPAPEPAAPPPAEGEAAGGEKKIDPKMLITETRAALDRSRAFKGKSWTLIEKINRESKILNIRTEDCLARRCTELAELKKNLEAHALDVEAATVTAERSLARTEKRLDPRDPNRTAKLQQDKATLDKLRECRRVLQEEIRNKFAALEIDNMCRRVTAAKASEKKRAEGGGSMTRSSSSPAMTRNKDGMGSSAGALTDFGNGDDESTRPPSSIKPGSPAGGSKTLKNAAALGLAA